MPVTDTRVRNILADHADLNGLTLRVTVQLDRGEYVAVDKVLKNLGGSWCRKQRAHLFPTDPAPTLAAYIAGGPPPAPPRTTEGFVPTPPDVAAAVVRNHTEVEDLPDGAVVLEPSAGDGRLIEAVFNLNPNVLVEAVEPNPQRAAAIQAWGDPRVTVWVDTLEQWTAEHDGQGRFDAVVMNPPFSLPKQPTVWIDHVRCAWDLVAPGGVLTAIVPEGFTYRSDRRHKAMRMLVDEFGSWERLPDDAFGGVRTVLISLGKPPAPPESADVEDGNPAYFQPKLFPTTGGVW